MKTGFVSSEQSSLFFFLFIDILLAKTSTYTESTTTTITTTTTTTTFLTSQFNVVFKVCVAILMLFTELRTDFFVSF